MFGIDVKAYLIHWEMKKNYWMCDESGIHESRIQVKTFENEANMYWNIKAYKSVLPSLSHFQNNASCFIVMVIL